MKCDEDGCNTGEASFVIASSRMLPVCSTDLLVFLGISNPGIKSRKKFAWNSGIDIRGHDGKSCLT